MSGLREESREGKKEAQACVQDPEQWPLGSFPLTLGVEGAWPGVMERHQFQDHCPFRLSGLIHLLTDDG